MALVTTPGAALADSYASLIEADAYHAARANTAWSGLDTTKDAALRRATAWLDGRYKSRWPGYRLNGRTQSLDWPRANATDADGYAIEIDAIPAEIIAATCEAALREIVAPNSLSPDVTPGTAKVLTGVGALSWTPLRSNVSASDMAPTIMAVDAALSGLLQGGGSGGTTLVVRA